MIKACRAPLDTLASTELSAVSPNCFHEPKEKNEQRSVDPVQWLALNSLCSDMLTLTFQNNG